MQILKVALLAVIVLLAGLVLVGLFEGGNQGSIRSSRGEPADAGGVRQTTVGAAPSPKPPAFRTIRQVSIE
jgi:hypothetical protein